MSFKPVRNLLKKGKIEICDEWALLGVCLTHHFMKLVSISVPFPNIWFMLIKVLYFQDHAQIEFYTTFNALFIKQINFNLYSTLCPQSHKI